MVFKGYSDGTHSIQVKREGNETEFFPLSLNPQGGTVYINGNTAIHSGNISSQNVATSKYPYGLAGWQNTNNWINNSDVNFTHLFCWQDGYGGEAGFWTNKSGQMYMAIDGAFYQRRDSGGCWRVLDTHDFNGTISWSNVSSKPDVAIQATSNNFVFAGNEITWLPSGYTSVVYLNYRTTGSNGNCSYRFCNGSPSLANITVNAAYAESDRHAKKNIRDIDVDELRDLFNLSDKLLKKFTWKNTNKGSYGIIAQSLLKYCPEAVDSNTNEKSTMMSINYEVIYAKLFASVINEIKTLKNQVHALLKEK